MHRFLITGGAGFLGSNVAAAVLRRRLGTVTVADDFSTGRAEHLAEFAGDDRLRIERGSVGDAEWIAGLMPGHDTVYHFAANSDIARAADEPQIDFDNGTLLTARVLEAMRRGGVTRILFSSGSGVYGEAGTGCVKEDHAPLIPISTYGASKLASEALIASYCHMFGFTGVTLRFANIVGPRMTHGVTHDFIERLQAVPGHLRILGDGHQCKPYIHVSDVIEAIFLVQGRASAGYQFYNVGTTDQLTVREIAEIVVERMQIGPVRYEFTGGARGWRADVPVYRLDTAKLRACGWRNTMDSRAAVARAVEERLSEADVRAPRVARV